jgi:hypothetical protein
MTGRNKFNPFCKCLWTEFLAQALYNLQLHFQKTLHCFVLYVLNTKFWVQEEFDFQLIWHYRKAERDIAATASKELNDTLINLTANLPITVILLLLYISLLLKTTKACLCIDVFPFVLICCRSISETKQFAFATISLRLETIILVL